MTMIETHNLTKHFGDVVAVDSVDLEVERGTVHGLVGPNGSGKTTAMQLIIGLLQPTEGEAYVDGEPAGSMAAKERIGYSPQEVAMYDSMTGRRYLEYMGRAAGMSRGDARERTDELIEWLELTEAADRQTGTYSGGMQRRLSLAQAMIHDPDVLFLDEPTTGLDPTGRQRIMDTLEELADEGLTVFVSSHVLSELEQYIEMVSILQDGQLVLTDSISAVQEAYGGQAFAVQTSDDERVATILSETELVHSAEVTDGRVVVTTDEPDQFREQLQQMLVDEGISLRSLTEEGTLQEAFTDIVTGGGPAGRRSRERAGNEGSGRPEDDSERAGDGDTEEVQS